MTNNTKNKSGYQPQADVKVLQSYVMRNLTASWETTQWHSVCWQEHQLCLSYSTSHIEDAVSRYILNEINTRLALVDNLLIGHRTSLLLMTNITSVTPCSSFTESYSSQLQTYTRYMSLKLHNVGIRLIGNHTVVVCDKNQRGSHEIICQNQICPKCRLGCGVSPNTHAQELSSKFCLSSTEFLLVKYLTKLPWDLNVEIWMSSGMFAAVVVFGLPLMSNFAVQV